MYNNFLQKTQNKKKSIKVAMISMHASPISELGGYKSGGMNLYVKEIVKIANIIFSKYLIFKQSTIENIESVYIKI